MFELKKTDQVKKLVAITKSGSGISGPELARAHMQLGSLLAKEMPYMEPEDTTIIAVMRGGIFFAEGMYLQMGCRFDVFDPKHGEFVRPDTKNVILVDSVVNTGKTIRKIAEDNDALIACCVINEKAVSDLTDRLYTVRVSGNSFIGKPVVKQAGNVGPDTTMRLFNQI